MADASALPAPGNDMLPPAMDSSMPPAPMAAGGEMPPLDNSVASLSGPPSIGGDSLPPALEVPGTGEMSPPSLVTNDVVTGTASHAANLGLPSVPSDTKNGYLQDVPTLSSAKKPAA